MAEVSAADSLLERLKLTKYDRAACIAAIRGEAIPHALGHPLHRLCVIRGMRYHDGFAQELHGLLPVFTRALNARSIMSNSTPVLESAETTPYCIWHPKTASEETYRNLVQQYPHLAYLVGRSCAVAGYTELYNELNIQPDVHIAEEARECGNLAIYEAIVSKNVRYDIMNDYELRLDLENTTPAYLNGDTCVRWMLDIKQEFKDATSDFEESEDGSLYMSDVFAEEGFDRRTFNITEDMHIDEVESDGIAKRTLASRAELRWLYTPLPRDLPTVQKDLLVSMAAYYGDVDRYARLRRPEIVACEYPCCVRGVYHNTLFALWWANQKVSKSSRIGKAITARFIMNNVLSRLPLRDSEMPYLIWWPTPAKPETYRRLAQVHPEMLPQILRACIYAGYKKAFAALLPQVVPEKDLFFEAEHRQSDPYFREALDERVASLGVEVRYPEGAYWKLQFSGHILERSSNGLFKYLDASSIGSGFASPYDGLQCDGTEVETMLCLPDAWKVPAEEPDEGRNIPWEIDYMNWPPGMCSEVKLDWQEVRE